VEKKIAEATDVWRDLYFQKLDGIGDNANVKEKEEVLELVKNIKESLKPEVPEIQGFYSADENMDFISPFWEIQYNFMAANLNDFFDRKYLRAFLLFRGYFCQLRGIKS
jgi:hypothetical protein